MEALLCFSDQACTVSGPFDSVVCETDTSVLTGPNCPSLLKKRRVTKIHNSLVQRQSARLFPGFNFCYNALYILWKVARFVWMKEFRRHFRDRFFFHFPSLPDSRWLWMWFYVLLVKKWKPAKRNKKNQLQTSASTSQLADPSSPLDPHPSVQRDSHHQHDWSRHRIRCQDTNWYVVSFARLI